MNAHQLDVNGVILNTIVVDTLDVFPNLIDASVGGWVGDTWTGAEIIKKPRDIAAENAANNAEIHAQLAANDLAIVRALTENDAPRIAAFKLSQAALRAQLKQ